MKLDLQEIIRDINHVGLIRIAKRNETHDNNAEGYLITRKRGTQSLDVKGWDRTSWKVDLVGNSREINDDAVGTSEVCKLLEEVISKINLGKNYDIVIVYADGTVITNNDSIDAMVKRCREFNIALTEQHFSRQAYRIRKKIQEIIAAEQ